METEKRPRGSGRRKRTRSSAAGTADAADTADAAGSSVARTDPDDARDATATSVLSEMLSAPPVDVPLDDEPVPPPVVRPGRSSAEHPRGSRAAPPAEPDAPTEETPAFEQPDLADELGMAGTSGMALPDGTTYSLPNESLLEPGAGHATRTEANDAIVERLQDVFTEFKVDARVTG